MKARVLYYDVLNVLACISVVCMHSNGYIHSFIKDDWWWVRVLIEVICYFAVPVFFMLSGATLLDYRQKYSTKIFIKKRFIKTFCPFLFWSIFFYSLYLFKNREEVFLLKEILMNFTMGKIPYTNYWFFIPLFLLYAFIPFFALMIERMSTRQILSLCSLLFLLQSILPTLYAMINLDFKLSLPIGSYVIYLFLGYLISKLNVEKHDRIMYLIGLIAIVSMLVRYILIYTAETKNPYLFSYLGFFAIFPSLYIFLYIKKVTSCPYSTKINQLWAFLSKRSFGVYLIHTFLIILLGKYLEREHPVFIIVSTISVYITSVLLVYLMQKNRLLRILVP